MNNVVEGYISHLQEELSTENAMEHSYRPALKNLFQSINPEITAVNEPSKSKHGSPDLAFFSKKNSALRIGYVEAKDIYINLDEVEKTEQLKRYLGYSNLILTNYLEFRFFRNGQKYQTIEIAKKDGNFLLYTDSNFVNLEREIKAFLEGTPENIKSAKRLAEIMGGKAARIRANVHAYLENNTDEKNAELLRIYQVMQNLLVHDLSIEKFADMYAQTLVYGLFVARYYDKSSSTFSRVEARDLVPASNPFLRHFFDHIVGPSFDRRLGYIVDELCEVFTVSDVKEIVRIHYNLFGEAVDKDPIIHFYEDFLKEYDPKLRKDMGAYYTPVPVVKFIIQAVDDVLKKEFGLAAGLASTEKVQKKISTQGTKSKELFHRVQILDPAVGTATFLNEIIKFIYTSFKGQEGLWPSYAEKELLPRLHGFELMMAPYTIAHLKLAMTLKETGIDKFNKRLNVYLTNTLEEGIKEEGLFTAFGLAEAISEEGKIASDIKLKTPIMVVIGNPPYSISSNNKGTHIQNLIEIYKKDLNEQNINSLSDDYIKFIRFSEYLIQKNGEGIVAMITNNSFIDGITHRQMRKHLLETFDSIYIFDLHGNSKKKEISPEGGKDENIFNIQQGVSINIFVKKNTQKKGLGKVYFSELFGNRLFKFENLNNSNLETISWKELNYSVPYYFFVPKDFSLEKEYNKGFKLDDIFLKQGSGIKFRKDNLLVKSHFSRKSVQDLLKDMHSLDNQAIYKKYNFTDTRDWKLEEKKRFFINDDFENIQAVQYRPFDIRYTYYPLDKINQIIPRGDSRAGLMKNFIYPNTNIGLITCRNQSFKNLGFVSKFISDLRMYSNPGSIGSDYVFPLYLYYEDGTSASNLKKEIVNNFTRIIGEVSSEKIFNYIYAILQSINYRKRFKEFCKIDFPRIPYPKDCEQFDLLSKLGGKLKHLHLLEDSEVNNFSTTYSILGDNLIEKVSFNDGKVFINETQYFGNVPKVTWEFYVGGYQPAQKWLKDRKGKKLEFEDINHYQKIIVSLNKTREIMEEIDRVFIL